MEKHIAVVGKECWFSLLMMMQGRVIDLATSKMFGMKELVEKLKHQKWTCLFMCPFPMMYDKVMLHFYSNFKLLEDGTMSSMVRRVDLVLNAELLGEILRVHVNGFDVVTTQIGRAHV